MKVLSRCLNVPLPVLWKHCWTLKIAIHLQLFQEQTHCKAHLGKLSLSAPSCGRRICISQAKSRRLNTGIYVLAV